MQAIQGRRFECEGCGREHRWQVRLAGRRVKCACGHVMTAPVAPAPQTSAPDQVEQGLYDLVPSPEPQQRAAGSRHAAPALAGVPMPQTATINYRRADTADSPVNACFPDRVKDLYLPLALIGGGTVVEFAHTLLVHRGNLDLASRAMASTGVEMIANTVLMLVALYIVARMREISFGPVPTAIIKLCAISIAPGAAAVFVGWMPLGGILGMIVSFILYFALLGALFDLDEGDTWWCVIVGFGVKLLVVFAVVWYLA